MASTNSISIFIPQWKYDVFLSFRGEDTRFNFTDHLYANLFRRGITTFRDDESLKRGEEIAPELLKAIEESRFALIVFSENYAGSRWCLDELVSIMKCRKEMKQTVVPIFYHVDPSHVRNQTGKFGEAFSNYKEDSEEMKEKVQSWRSALTEATNISGEHVKDGYESEHIKKIVNNIFMRLNCRMFDVGANLVGMDSHVNEIIRQLCVDQLNDVRIIGICGIGGMGKTSIAKVIYNKFSHEFEYMSFLENVREVGNTMGLHHLQNQLLCDLLQVERNQNVSNVGQGANMIKNVLRFKRVFIVLDDIDDSDQLEYLLRNRDWLGRGSRVIITTRSKHLLQEMDDVYEVEELNFEQARELFSLYAFRQNLPKQDFIHLSNRVIYYCHGLPLALKVLGSLLFNKTILQWESELCKLEREPEVKIQNVLKVSFDGLDHTQKKIFLDIACFFKGEDKDFVSRILDSCDLYAEIGIKVLYDKCLISLSENKILMHDLVQEMGWNIIRSEFPDNPGKWSRLWDPSDVYRAFTMKKGMKNVEAIFLNLSRSKQLQFSTKVFAKMKRLRLLKIYGMDCCGFMKKEYKIILPEDFQFPSQELRYLHWKGYPLKSLPSNFHGENLVVLNMMDSKIKQLWQGNKCLGKLKFLNLLGSKQLTEISNFSNMPNLGELELGYCTSLNIVDPSIGVLKKLTLLSLSGCENLTSLPSSIQYLDSLETIYLNNCSNLEKFLEIEESSMEALTYLHFDRSAIKELPSAIKYLLEDLLLFVCSNPDAFPEIMEDMKEFLDSRTGIKELPSSMEHLLNINSLFLSDFKNLRSLLSSIRRFKSFRRLFLNGCSSLRNFPEIMEGMKYLEVLGLEGTAIKELPSSIQNLKSLQMLYLSNCKNLVTIPDSINDLRCLKRLILPGCSNLEKFPKNLEGLCTLVELDLSHCNLMEGSIPTDIWGLYSLCTLNLSGNHMVSIPSGITQLCRLRLLDISHCKMLQEIPELSSSLPQIDAHGCTKLEMLSSPSSLLCPFLKWFKRFNPTSNEYMNRNWKKGKVIIIPGNGGIPGWVLHQEIGSQVRIELPLNWYEDDHFLGLAFFFLYHKGNHFEVPYYFDLTLHGDSDEVVDHLSMDSLCKCHEINGDVSDELWVTLYPKNAIPNKYHRNQPWHFLAAFDFSTRINGEVTHPNIKRCGVQLMYTRDSLNSSVPMLLDHQRGHDDAGKNQADDREPCRKRLRASSTDLKL
ncbi:hypothetical protein VitviT2T_007106 [Vitis vinifera]|uniref:ADP-ribosyl cyclase/cyclic ADP-ribose hydrolase n=1 Tax=Vitis vinifera TaxID=29760 RepID=A0ABY9BY74_VITVI|nr:disease resistance protein RUN1-like [Vitis vinifera]WJZ87751.1 hypothetical protein VitviT2T_007106 [Vitis vinifera]